MTFGICRIRNQEVIDPRCQRLETPNSGPQVCSRFERMLRSVDQEMGSSQASHICEPCVFFFSTHGCDKGNQCAFCHHAVQDEAVEDVLARPTKLRRLKIKDTILLQMIAAKDSTEMHHQLQTTARRHSYARTLIQSYLNMSYISSDDNVSLVFSL